MRKILATTALAAMLATGSIALAETKDGTTDSGKFHKIMEEKLSKLPQDKRDLVKKAFDEGREEGKANREKFKKLHEEIKSIMTAEKFDKDAYLAKSAEISKLHNDMQAKRAERMADLASKLNADERKVLVDMMPKPHKFGGKPGGGKGGEDAPPPPPM